MTCPVVIADDLPVITAGVKATLKTHAYEIVACVNDTDTLLHSLAETDCEVLVIDPFMPDGVQPDSVELIHTIRERHPDVGIAIMSRMGSQLPALRRMLELGVSSLFDKRAHVRGLTMAVQAASIGRVFMSPSVRRAFLDYEPARSSTTPPPTLSQRELAVLRAFSQGMSLPEVGELMHRSIKTISRQKRSAMQKLGLPNDAQLYQYLADMREGRAEAFVTETFAPLEDEDDAYVAIKARTARAKP